MAEIILFVSIGAQGLFPFALHQSGRHKRRDIWMGKHDPMLKSNRTVKEGANHDDDGPNSTRSVKRIERETGNKWVSCIRDDGIVHGRCTRVFTRIEITFGDIRRSSAPVLLVGIITRQPHG